MAIIVIKDLSENVDLDRKAMQAITGGARLRGRHGSAVRSTLPDVRAQAQPQGQKRRPTPSVLFK